MDAFFLPVNAPARIQNIFAKLSPAQLKLQLSWAEFALFPLSPTDHPPATHPPRESLFLKLQQVLMVRNLV